MKGLLLPGHRAGGRLCAGTVKSWSVSIRHSLRWYCRWALRRGQPDFLTSSCGLLVANLSKRTEPNSSRDYPCTPASSFYTLCGWFQMIWKDHSWPPWILKSLSSQGCWKQLVPDFLLSETFMNSRWPCSHFHFGLRKRKSTPPSGRTNY